MHFSVWTLSLRYGAQRSISCHHVCLIGLCKCIWNFQIQHFQYTILDLSLYQTALLENLIFKVWKPRCTVVSRNLDAWNCVFWKREMLVKMHKKYSLCSSFALVCRQMGCILSACNRGKHASASLASRGRLIFSATLAEGEEECACVAPFISLACSQLPHQASLLAYWYHGCTLAAILLG